MSKYEFKAINLIAEAFEKHDAKFRVFNIRGQEELVAGFSVDAGPNVMMKFITRDNDNDVAARIFGLITKTPKEKRSRVMEACNDLNRKTRFMKFYVDTDGDINVEYDFPVQSSDECIGEMAFEIFVRTMQILDHEYEIFMKALYSDEELETPDTDVPSGLREMLEDLRKRLEARINAEEDDKKDEDDEEDEDTASSATSSDDNSPEEDQESFDAFLKMLLDGDDLEDADSSETEDIA